MPVEAEEVESEDEVDEEAAVTEPRRAGSHDGGGRPADGLGLHRQEGEAMLYLLFIPRCLDLQLLLLLMLLSCWS